MKDDEILVMYKIGYSIDYISKQYFRMVNKNVRQDFYVGNRLIVHKKNIGKQQAYDYVCKVILDDCLKNNK